MKAVLHVRSLLQNLRLSKKIMAISALCIILVGLVSLIGSIAFLKIYEEQLFSKTADILTNTGSQLEEKLKSCAALSEYIVSDALLQNSLSVLREEEPDSFERAEINRQLYKAFSGYSSSGKYIIQFSIQKNEFQIITIGKDSSPESEEVQRLIIEASSKSDGRESWVYTGRNDSSILCVRPVREIKNLSFDTLGILVIRIDLEQMVKDALKSSSIDPKSRLIAIFNSDRIVYPINNSGFKKLPSSFSGTGSYKIVTIANERFFVAKKTFDYLDWTYLEFIPYSNIFRSLVDFFTILILSILFSMVLSISIAHWLSNGTTHHLNLLVDKMAVFGTGSPAPELELQYRHRTDEAGQLHRNFYHMAMEIERLIENNYVKQLLIKDAQIKALKQQINPHFLYNTLESINWQAKFCHQPQISQMAESLGKMLRFAIREDRDVIPIETELSMVDWYIRIQKIRYNDRLLYETDIDNRIIKSLIPKMSIQPLVENAIIHALEQMTDVCTVKLAAYVEGPDILISVQNNGSRIDEDVLGKLEANVYKPSGNGIGLVNIDKRIKLIFGEKYGLSFRDLYDGVRAIIKIPQIFEL